MVILFLSTNKPIRININCFHLSGPKQNTLSDFWHMIWQENVFQIVMLTNLREGTKVCFMFDYLNIFKFVLEIVINSSGHIQTVNCLWIKMVSCLFFQRINVLSIGRRQIGKLLLEVWLCI